MDVYQDQELSVDILPILTTKLYRPPIMPDLEVREELLAHLERNRHRPLTLISAPAGYGKSTLASMWLDRCDYASAWISLDEGDSEINTFLMYVVAAIQGAFPDAELNTYYLLNSTSLSPRVDAARYLLSDLDQIGEPFVLVLDDVHLIREQVVHNLLAGLLRHPLPNFQLVLATRRDPPLPLATMRARGQMTEIRARDLRFSVSETSQLMEKRLGYKVDDTVVSEWTAKTEGWATAIHLATLSLQYRSTHDFSLDFREDSGFVQDYLMAEVLSRLPGERHDWLLSTSVLDRFCASLCEAVCGQDCVGNTPDMTGEGFIRWLLDSNLFVIPVDEKRVWFRYHHLFQEMLQDALLERFDSAAIAELHRRASYWFAENRLLDDAIRHAVEGEDIDTAVRILEQNRHDLLNAGQWRRLDAWLASLPEEVVRDSLPLTSAQGIVAYQLGHDSSLAASLHRVNELVETASPYPLMDRSTIGEMSAMRGMAASLLTGTADELFELAQNALEMLPSKAHHLRAQMIGFRLLGEQMNGQLKRGEIVTRATLSQPDWPPHLITEILHDWSLVCILDGDLATAMKCSVESLRISDAHRLAGALNEARHNLGVCHYLKDELDLAEPLLESLADAWELATPSYVSYGIFALALIRLAQGRSLEAESLVDQLLDHYPSSEDFAASRVAQACQVELQIRVGKISQARSMSMVVDFDFRPPLWFFWAHQLTPIKLLLAEGTASSIASARESLEALDAQMRSIHRNSVRIDALALLSITCAAQGDNATSSAKLVEALTLGERGGHIRNFVDLGPPMEDLLNRLRDEPGEAQQSLRPYIDRILAAFPTPGPDDSHPSSPSAGWQATSTMPELIEPLTERELQVLRLLATELTPAEIADQLVVSVDTVRTHTKNLYFKLDVHSRPEAVHRAREQGIISSP